MGKRKTKPAAGLALSAKETAEAGRLLAVLAAQAERDKKAGHKVTYATDAGTKALAEAVTAARLRGLSVWAARTLAEAATVSGQPVTVPSVRRADLLVGEAAGKPLNDRPENAVLARLAKWSTVRGLAWVGTLHAVPMRGEARKADRERVIIGIK
jgi:hypothetical protein